MSGSPNGGSKACCQSSSLLPDLLSPAFDYGVVDGLGRAAQRGRVPQLDGQIFRAAAAGPIVEFIQLESADNLAALRASDWFDDGSLGPMLAPLAARPVQWLAQDGRQGLISAVGLEREDILTSFKIDAHKAALAAGFTGTAALLVAAMGELIGNVIDHSEALDSGVALFVTQSGQFEFVIADCGVGARASLIRNPEYASLSDEGSALQAMIEPGVSRFARETGHGNGFRPIFEKLANMTGHLRFRSGDHALTLDGRFGDRVARQLAQKPRLRGVFVAVSCRTPTMTSRR